jgi:threonine synthase
LLLEPHGAVGWCGYQAAIAADPSLEAIPAAVAETAHPAKFPEEIEATLGFAPEVPPALAALDGLHESFDEMATDYAAFSELLRKEYAK